MTLTMQPYQYMKINEIVYNLVHQYQAVNDLSTVAALQELAAEEIHETIPGNYPEIDQLLTNIMDRRLRHRATEKMVRELKPFVVPFVEPNKKANRTGFSQNEKINIARFNGC